MLDAIAILGVMPLVALIVNPEIIHSNTYLIILHNFMGNPEMGHFLFLLALMAILVMLFTMICIVIIQNKAKVYGVVTQTKLAKKYLNKILGLNYSWFLDKNTTECAHYVFTDITIWMNDGVLRGLNFIGYVSLIIIYSIMIILVSPFEALIALLVASVFTYFIISYSRIPITRLSKIRRGSAANSLASASNIFSAIKEIKTMNKGEYFRDNYLRLFSKYGMTGTKLRLIQSLTPPIILFFAQAALISYVLLLWNNNHNSVEIAAKMALIVLITSRLIPGVTRLANEINVIWTITPHLESLDKNLSEFDSYNNLKFNTDNKIENDKVISCDWNEIILKDLSYKYPEKDNFALSKLNLKMKKGKSYGVAGPSGSGKTTFLNIILGLLYPDSGSITIDEIKLDHKRIHSWQKIIGYVPQSPLILDETLRRNIAFGLEDDQISDTKVMDCIEKANLSEFIRSNSMNLDTSLGDRGIMISGGESQRICIARALYNNPEILILDEATSALDPLNEKAIKQSIRNIKSEITVITIAHRLTTIEECDKIFLFESGELVANGTYANLVNTSKLFRSMVSNIE